MAVQIKEHQAGRLYYLAAADAKARRVLKCRALPGEDRAALSEILAILQPADEAPAISELANEKGFAVEAVVPANLAAELVLALHEANAASIVVQSIEHFVP